jgi:hypothetical protein
MEKTLSLLTTTAKIYWSLLQEHKQKMKILELKENI